MKEVVIGGVSIGSGRPKICVPVVAHTMEELILQADEISRLPADLVEWRADFFDSWQDPESVSLAVRALKARLNMPLLFTFRTAAEGGETAISPEAYRSLLTSAASLDGVDLIDVEVFFDKDTVSELIRNVHAAGKYVLASNHDFDRTPPSGELKRRLLYMEKTGADIAKIAVMPQTREDVFRLMKVTAAVQEHNSPDLPDDRCGGSAGADSPSAALHIPVVTMSMGRLGTLSRVAGEFTGSAITFGAAGLASAPGQIEVRRLAEMLKLMHELT